MYLPYSFLAQCNLLHNRSIRKTLQITRLHVRLLNLCGVSEATFSIRRFRWAHYLGFIDECSDTCIGAGSRRNPGPGSGRWISRSQGRQGRTSLAEENTIEGITVGEDTVPRVFGSSWKSVHYLAIDIQSTRFQFSKSDRTGRDTVGMDYTVWLDYSLPYHRLPPYYRSLPHPCVSKGKPWGVRYVWDSSTVAAIL